MKFFTLVFVLATAFSVQANEQTVENTNWYKYSCTFVDGNNVPHWGGSASSEAEAYNRAWSDCNRGEMYGSCTFAGCQTRFSPVAMKSMKAVNGYGCSATDANYGHYWGTSNASQTDACMNAMNNCYYHSDAPGTCTLR